MDKENLIIGVHGSNDLVGGHYNVLASFTSGLMKGFKNNGVKVYTTKECFDKGIAPNLVIGFNASGYNTWREYITHDIPNIMWSVDSVFYQNIEAVAEFNAHPKFVLFNVSPSDTEALQAFFPLLQFAYMPHAVDPELWQKKDLKKEHDVVFMSSIIDYEAKIEELRQTMDPKSFELLMILYDTWLNASNLSFWQIYQIFKKEGGLDFNLGQYNFSMKNLAYLVTHTKRAQMIEKLQDFNVKVFGDGPWEKYVKGNVQYMGKCDLLESIDIVNKAKIVLHNHPTQLSLGLHERILNASAAQTFVISSDNISIMEEFGHSMDYYKSANLDNLVESVDKHLKNDGEREEKAKKAREITLQKHTWDVRAEQILSMLNEN